MNPEQVDTLAAKWLSAGWTDSNQERAQAAFSLAWGEPSPVVPPVVSALETFDCPPTASDLAGRVQEREGVDFETARQYVRRTADAGAIIEAKISGDYRYALHATDFRKLTM